MQNLIESLSSFRNTVKRVFISTQYPLASFLILIFFIVIVDYNKKIQVSELQRQVDSSFLNNLKLLEEQMKILNEQNKRSVDDHKLLSEYRNFNEERVKELKRVDDISSRDRQELRKAQEALAKKQEEILKRLDK
jgi:hypothetical protein